MSERDFWIGDWTEPGIKFRIEVSAEHVELIWYTPNPHGGVDVGHRRTLEQFLANEDDHDTVRTACGAETLSEIIAVVTRLRQQRQHS